MYDAILFPTDGSDGAAVALDHALDLADTYDAVLHALYVVDTDGNTVVTVGDTVVDVLERTGEEAVRDVASAGRERGVRTETAVRRGDPYRAIVDYASDSGADLVVMATHGRRGLDRYLLGSVTEKVVRTAETPVLTVRMGDEEGE